MANAALTNDTTPTLTWTAVTGANLYTAQISLYADFRSVTASSAVLGSASYTPSAITTGFKYYWRWRSSSDGGTTWGAWSEVYSFWLNSSWSTSVTPTNNSWVMVNPDDITDTYTLPIYPEHAIREPEIMRVDRRNLKGTLLTENIGVTKAMITLSHQEAYITRAHLNEFLRFYHMAEPIYLLSSIYNQTDYVERAWLAQMEEPSFTPLGRGRHDYYRATIPFKEA